MTILSLVKDNAVALVLACTTTAFMVFISEGSYSAAANTLERLVNMAQARTTIQTLERGLLNAETGQRGYLLTERKEFLQPYLQARVEIDRSLAWLTDYYAGDAERQQPLQQLHEMAVAKLSKLQASIDLQNSGRRQAALDIVSAQLASEQMDALREASAALLAHETAKVAAGREEINRTLLLSRLGVAALSMMSLLVLLLYLRQSTLVQRQQRQLKDLMQVDHDRLEQQVAERTAELTELTKHLLTAREDERSRIARDLHDELGALLTAAKLDAARIKSRLGSAAPEAQDRLRQLVATLDSGIALKRRIIEDLRPSTLSNLGLVATIEILAREFGERAGVAVHVDLQPVSAEAATEIVIYRLVQEALTNVTKHAHAHQVWINLRKAGDSVLLVVRDDGVGFDTAARKSSANGLAGMRFRVTAAHGTLHLESSPERGTSITVLLPSSPDPATATGTGT